MLNHTQDNIKVDTAVILAARRERDGSIPYPLRTFSTGQGSDCLLERSLRLLRELGITNIILVVGYEAKLFEVYKASDVRIVYSPDYLYSASMSSLAAASSLIDRDFLLIEGDTFYEKYVLEQLLASPSPNCLSIANESGSGDEAFVEVEQGYVKKISKDKHQICRISGELLGISKISYATYRRMLEAWQYSNNPQLNYEYLFVDVTSILERPSILFKDLIWGDVDCYDDFVELNNYTFPKLRRKEDPFDYENILMHLSAIFPGRDVVSDLHLKQIGGMSNRNYYTCLGKDQYVLRIPGLGSEGMVVRRYEEENAQHAANLGINPPIRYFSNETGVKLADYIIEAETLNQATVQRHDNMRQIAEVMAKLHNSNIRFNNDFNVFKEILHYEELVQNSGASYYDGYEEVRERVLSLEARLNEIGVRLKPCHNDLVAENFIKDKSGKIYLIDWEYSGMNDPMWDIAALFLESNFSEENEEYFLCQYLGVSEVPQMYLTKVRIYQILMDTLWSLWTIVKEAKGDDFGSYGTDRLARGIQMLNELENNGKLH